MGLGLLTAEVSRSHSNTHTHTLSTTPLNDWLVRHTDNLAGNTQQSQQTDIHAAGGIRTHKSSKREAANLILRPRGRQGRQVSL